MLPSPLLSFHGDSLLHLELMLPDAGFLQLSPWQPSQHNDGDGPSHGQLVRQGHIRGRGQIADPPFMSRRFANLTQDEPLKSDIVYSSGKGKVSPDNYATDSVLEIVHCSNMTGAGIMAEQSPGMLPGMLNH